MREPERTTIHDVARAAGVSHQTVSNVLNGTGRVGAATRARVAETITTLNYRPHAGAASLRTGRSGRIAYPLAAGDLGPANTIMLEFVEALTAAAARRGRHLLLAAGADGLDGLLREGGADAVVLANVTRQDERVRALARRGVPFACFGRTDEDMPQNWVDVDDRRGVHDLTARLVADGHTRVAFLGYAPQGPWDDNREAGFRAATGDAGLTASVSLPGMAPALVRAAIDALLDAGPTAIVTGSDVLAATLYTVAAHRGLRIGTDLAVTGFDGSMVGRLLTPTLTTLAIPTATIAERVVARALSEVDGSTGELLPPELVRGESG